MVPAVFYQASLTIYWYPFTTCILLGGERHLAQDRNTLGQGPVLDVSANLAGLTPYFKIKSKRIEKQALTP